VTRALRGCLVTGTDTGAGKTVLAAAVIASMRARGHAVRALKPVLTGLDEPADPVWPPDHELLARVAGCRAEQVILAGYGPSVSPHLAGELSGRELALPELAARIAAAARPGAVLVVEGVGGLLVPLGPGFDVRDLAREIGLPLLVAARPGLGTINHTRLTLEAARAARLEVAGVVLTPWPARPDTIARSNLETIERLGEVEVGTLGMVAEPTPQALAQAAADLPLERWLRSG
jgi:dethiobiotin synthetase